MLPDTDAVASVELEYHPLKTLAARLRGGNGIQNQGLQPAARSSSTRSVHSQSFDVPAVARYWVISVANVMGTLALSTEDIKRKRPKYVGSREQRW